MRGEAKIIHVDDETGKTSSKHLHDLRDTFSTRLLTDRETADIMGWSRDRVAAIRRVYVDQSRMVVALGKRIKHIAIKRAVK